MFLGAHQSISGGYATSLERISQIGGNCLQVFSTSPRSFGFAHPNQEAVELFVSRKEKLSISPVYFHASYLLNLASSERIGEFSKNFLIHELLLAETLGIRGTIIHLGSYKGNKTKEATQTLLRTIENVLLKAPQSTYFIIENAGTNKLCQRIEEIGEIVLNLQDPRVRVCLDTCHLHAAGYDLSTPKKLEEFLEKFDSLVGVSRIELFHMNDSKDEFHSCRDRHENIGQGKVGIGVFQHILNHPRLRDLPFIIETPGFNDKGPDKKNLDILKLLCHK